MAASLVAVADAEEDKDWGCSAGYPALGSLGPLGSEDGGREGSSGPG